MQKRGFVKVTDQGLEYGDPLTDAEVRSLGFFPTEKPNEIRFMTTVSIKGPLGYGDESDHVVAAGDCFTPHLMDVISVTTGRDQERFLVRCQMVDAAKEVTGANADTR